MSLESLVCPQCGGTINPATMACEYCGARFKTEMEVLKISAEQPGEHTLGASVMLDNELMRHAGAEQISELALKEIAQKMAKCIMPYISIHTKENWGTNATEVRGYLRILDPKEWA